MTHNTHTKAARCDRINAPVNYVENIVVVPLVENDFAWFDIPALHHSEHRAPLALAQADEQLAVSGCQLESRQLIVLFRRQSGLYATTNQHLESENQRVSSVSRARE